MSDETVLVVPASVREGTCKYCRRRVLWAVVARTHGRPARTLPFNLSVRSLDTPETVHQTETGLTYACWPASAVHMKTCPDQPKPDPTNQRILTSARQRQGRIW